MKGGHPQSLFAKDCEVLSTPVNERKGLKGSVFPNFSEIRASPGENLFHIARFLPALRLQQVEQEGSDML
jgi:hypothetical protein